MADRTPNAPATAAVSMPSLQLRSTVGSGAHAVWSRSGRVVLDNNLAIVGGFTDSLVAACAPELDDAAADELRIAVRELLTNAIEHGNLALSFEDRSSLAARGQFKEELQRRRVEADQQRRKVEIWVRRSDDAVMIQIRDDGAGFDWRALPDEDDPAHLLDDHGRGVWLAKLSVDHLQYNDSGNQVTIIKRIPKRGALAAHAGPRPR